MPAKRRGKLAPATVGALADLDAMWASVDAVRAKQVPSARPPGYFTVIEYAEEYGLTDPTAMRQLRRMKKAGELEEIRILAADRSGKLRAHIAFRVLKKAA